MTTSLLARGAVHGFAPGRLAGRQSTRSIASKRKPPGMKGPASTPTAEESGNRTIQRNMFKRNPYHQEILHANPETLMHAQMYTPETLKSENLTLNCFRMVAYGLHMPEILDRYGDRAAELASGLRPDEFSKILTAFARAEHRHEGMLRAFARQIPARLSQFLPMDLSQTCNAYAKLRERDERLFRQVSSEMPHKLPLFEPYQLKNVANAYARLSIRDDLLFDDIADEVLRRPQEFGAVDLYLLANAFASFRIRHPRLWLVLADWLLETHLDLGAVEIAVLLNSMSSVGFHHDVLLEALIRGLTEEPLLSGLDASTNTLALNALARLQWPGLSMIDGATSALADRAVALLPDLDPAGMTRLLHACTRLRPLAEHEGLVDGVLSCAQDRVADFNAQSLSLLVHSCAALRKRDATLLTKVAKAVPTRIVEFTPQALAMTAHGFQKLEIRSEILFYLLAEESCEKMPLFTGQGVSMLLRAFGKLNVKNERLVQACRKQVRALAEELSLPEIQAIEAGFRELGALDASTDAVLRRQRQHLGASQAAVGAPRDPWASEEERLLHRLAERPAKPITAAPLPSQQQESKAPSHGIDSPRTLEEQTESKQRKSGDDEKPDVWDLWSASHDAGGGSGLGEATPPSRLREYLTRPERVGRRAQVVDRDGQAEWPSAVDDATSETIPEQRRGRRSRR